MGKVRLLLVDDDEGVRISRSKVLEHHGFEVTLAANTPEALHLITSQTFDVLLSDLHMPGPGDGLTVVSAMRHANPKAVTLLLSAYPAMTAATKAILMQTDEIMVKPMNIANLVKTINDRLAAGPTKAPEVETVATILRRTALTTIATWYKHVQEEKTLMAVPMTADERTEHLPRLFEDLSVRLESHKPLGTKELESDAACDHGLARRRIGYTAAMMVQESRILQVSIFQSLQDNLAHIDFSVLLLGVMTIADEVDSQLSQAMHCYVAESRFDDLPVLA